MDYRKPLLSHINYSFSTEGLHPALAARHADFAREYCANIFFMHRNDVNVSSKARLPENAPFSLTCYVTKSESCPVSMIRASKTLLPHLEDMRKLSADNAWALAIWEPGEDEEKDLEAVGIISEGLGMPTSSEQRDWLAAVQGVASAAAETFSAKKAAQMAFDNIMNRRREDAEAQRNKDARAEYQAGYYKITFYAPSGKRTTLSMERERYLDLIEQTGLDIRRLNKRIRDVAESLAKEATDTVFSKAVVALVGSTLTGAAQ